jgi:hypothetical protein
MSQNSQQAGGIKSNFFIASGAANTPKSFLFQTGGKNRWSLISTNAAESGANAGSGFAIARYDDTGTLIDYPLSIDRKTGIVTFSQVEEKPINPAFGVILSANLTNLTGDGTIISPIPFNTKSFDQDNNFNVATSQFIAPFTGVYHFTMGVYLSNIGASHTSAQVSINTPTSQYATDLGDLVNSRDPNNSISGSLNVVTHLTAGDAVFCQAVVNNGTKVVGLAAIATGGYVASWFQGFFVG